MKLFKSIKTRITFVFGLSTIIILIVVSLMSYSYSKRIAKKLTINHLNNLTDQALNVLSLSVDNSIKNYLRGIAEKNLEIANLYYQKSQKGELSEEQAKREIEVILFNQRIGDSGYTYVLNTEGVILIHPILKNQSIKSKDLYKQQIEKKTGYIEYLWKNPGDKEAYPKSLYSVYFEPWDYIISVSSYKNEFYKLINPETFKEPLLSIKIGKTGYCFVVDSKAETLIHPELEGVNNYSTKSFDGINIAQEIIKKKNGVIRYLWKNSNEKKPRMKLVYFRHYEDLNWFIAVGAYEDEVFKDISDFNKILFFMILSGIIVTIIISIIISYSISKPVIKLKDDIEQFTKGEYSRRSIVSSHDEISQLSKTFNKMAEKIEDDFEVIAKSNKEIEDLKNYLSDIIESMDSIIISTDRNGNIIEANIKPFSYMGISREMLIGKKLWHDIEILKKYAKDCESVLFTDKEIILHREQVHINDAISYYLVKITKMKDGGLLFKADDITELEKKDEQIRHVQKMDMIGTLAGGLAHDFNNVLGGIIGTVSLMRLKYDDNDTKIDRVELKEEISIIDNASRRAADMVSRLLTLSRDNGVVVDNFNLIEIIEQVIKISSNSFDKCVEIKKAFLLDKAVVKGDITQIEQMFLNLFLNGYHSMTIMRGEGEKKEGILSVSIERVNGKVFKKIISENMKDQFYYLIKISDTGVGIPEEVINKIFEPFFTTKPQGVGTGLGLSMVYNTIKQHDGFIKIYSRVGTGTTINLFLPESSDSLVNDLSNDVKIIKGVGKVLVADDEEIMRSTAKVLLEECGYEVVLAEDGFGAIEEFSNHKDKYDCILIDLSMPKMSGIEAYKEIKKIRKDVGVIATSGFLYDKIIPDINSSGIIDFISKPFSIEEISSIVDKVIRKPL